MTASLPKLKQPEQISTIFNSPSQSKPVAGYDDTLDEMHQQSSKQETAVNQKKFEPQTEAKRELDDMMSKKRIYPLHSQKLDL